MSTRKHARLGRVTATAVALAAALVACGNDDGAATPATAPRTSESAASAATSADTTSPPVVTTTATDPPTATAPTTESPAEDVELPTARSEIVPTPGDLPNGVYRFTQTVDDLKTADPDGSFAASDEFIGEYTLVDGTSELRYFNIDGTPMQGEPPDTGGVYEVRGDLIIFAAPPERSMPGTNGINLLRWSLDDDTLTLEQVDDNALDADFIAQWIRVGDAP